MEPAEVLAQIKPCDMDNPYIFVSYSARDHQRVWEDVLAFQQLGYNVWLDERNLDKTKDSWTEDALSAISDLDCLLVVFYVSSTSLTSEACFRELNQTTETMTVRIHFGQVRFIAVDVENVGDIGAFTQEVYTNLMLRKDITKKEKTAKAIILSQFCDKFFGSNNERVRVHPKDEPNRKIGYYEEIVASFPDAAKIYPPVKTLAELDPKKKHIPTPPPAPEPAPDPIPAPTPEPQEVPEEKTTPLSEQLSTQLGRKSEPLLAWTASPTSADQDAAVPDTPASESSAQEQSGAASTSSLVEQISSLLSSKGSDKKEDKPPESGDAPQEEGERKPTLAELIQRKLEEQKKDDKKK